MLIRVMLSEAMSDPPTLMGAGKDYGKSENPSAFYKTTSCPIFYFRMHVPVYRNQE